MQALGRHVLNRRLSATGGGGVTDRPPRAHAGARQREEEHTSDGCQNSRRDAVIGGAQRLRRLRGDKMMGGGGLRRTLENQTEGEKMTPKL